MRKNILVLILVLCLCKSNAIADSWDDFSNVDRMWDGQKSITNQQFEQVMEKLEEKGKQREQKIQKKKRKKLFGSGTTLHSELNPDNDIPEIQAPVSKDDGILINLPVDIVVNNTHLEKGYYNVFAQKDKESGKLYIKFYQSQFFKGEIEATETDDDYGEENINFAKIIPYDDSFVKIIFGSLEFNAYSYIPYLH